MTSHKINSIRDLVKEQKPLIHSITNPISINQCANACLAVGARPIMAEHPGEVADITETAQALMLNLGNITDARLKSIEISAAVAKECGIPFVLDAVGVACSPLRRDFARKIIEDNRPMVIKGNYSEIKTLFDEEYSSEGVDAEELQVVEISRLATQLSKKHNTVILASGKVDIVTNGKELVYVKNGCAQLGSVTGTGCMLGELCACYLAVSEGLEAAVTACAVLGICGELSHPPKGCGTFMVNLMDNLSTLSGEAVNNNLKIEVKKVEKI